MWQRDRGVWSRLLELQYRPEPHKTLHVFRLNFFPIFTIFLVFIVDFWFFTRTFILVFIVHPWPGRYYCWCWFLDRLESRCLSGWLFGVGNGCHTGYGGSCVTRRRWLAAAAGKRWESCEQGSSVFWMAVKNKWNFGKFAINLWWGFNVGLKNYENDYRVNLTRTDFDSGSLVRFAKIVMEF